MPLSKTRLRERYWRATNLKLDPLHQEFNDWRHPNENTAAARGLVHPARFSYKLYDVFADLLRAEYGTEQDFLVLDPFAGIGGVHNLPFYIPNALTFGVEIEKEWAECHPNTMHGNSFFLDRIFAPNTFDAVVTSPCLTPDQRILRADLRWIPCGDLKVGDRIIAFDEFPTTKTAHNHLSRRRWRFATVEESYPARKRCVRVTLENGDVVTCSHDHPWLANRYRDNSRGSGWVAADQLMTLYDPHVFKQLEPWQWDRSWESGWLAGVMDSEGSLAWGEHGSPKLQISQVAGIVQDEIWRVLAYKGIQFTGYQRALIANRQAIFSTFINGGFPEILSTLGRFRPERLISKLDTLDLVSRTVRAKKIRVVSVEDIGEQDIQAIQTSARTYIGEGYLHHNTYANRMADTFKPSPTDTSKRLSYTLALGRRLTPGTTASLQWGQHYRDLHFNIWRKCYTVVRPGGLFILNIKDHIREKKVVPVTDFHIDALTQIGFVMESHTYVALNGFRFGKNFKSRMKHESVIQFRKPSAPPPVDDRAK